MLELSGTPITDLGLAKLAELGYLGDPAAANQHEVITTPIAKIDGDVAKNGVGQAADAPLPKTDTPKIEAPSVARIRDTLLQEDTRIMKEEAERRKKVPVPARGG